MHMRADGACCCDWCRAGKPRKGWRLRLRTRSELVDLGLLPPEPVARGLAMPGLAYRPFWVSQ